MVHITGEVIINRPVEEVFDFVADATNEPLYNPMILRSEKLTDGPVGLGARFWDETKSMGRPVEILIEFIGYERPHQIIESVSLPGASTQGVLTFDPAPSGTRMRWSWHVIPHGALKLMTPVIALIGRRQEKATRMGLKRYMEGEAVQASAGSTPLEIAPGVYWLPIRGSNVYFVRSDDAWALIDTAWGRSAPIIRQAAETLFGDGARPEAILLTHDHPDHVGAALELARFWDCPVYLHPDELPLALAENLATVERYANPMDRWVILPLVRALPRRRYEAMLARSSLRGVARALDLDGSAPGLPDWRWIHTPGHAPGHVAFFRPSDRILIAGDAVMIPGLGSPRTLLQRALRRDRPRVALPLWYTNWQLQATIASALVLSRLDPSVLASGHGTPIAGPTASADLHALANQLTPETAPVEEGNRGGGATMKDPARLALVGVDACVAVTAVRGGVALVTGLEGDRIPLEMLRDTPFSSYTVPGLLLAGVVGGSASVATVAALRSPTLGGLASIVAGVIMMGWITGETRTLKRPASRWELAYFLAGLLMAVLGWSVRRTAGRRNCVVTSIAPCDQRPRPAPDKRSP